MPSYLADKQAGYPKTQSAIQRDEFPDDVRQAVQKYIRKHSPVPADRTARVIERLSK